jgi:hypothetical protein
MIFFVPVSPLIPYNIKFVQRGFTKRAAFKERPRAGQGKPVLSRNLLEGPEEYHAKPARITGLRPEI